MKKFLLTTLCLLAGITGVGEANPTPSSGGNPDRGMVLFSSYCAGCHGDFGRGDGPIAPRLMRDYNVKPADLTLPAWQAGRTDADLIKTIRGGGAAMHRTNFMPAWGQTLNAQQQKDLVSFLRELARPSATGYQPASTLGVQQNLELGRILFGLHCVACHGTRGKGDGPRLQQAREEGMEIACPDFSKPDYALNKTDAELLEYANSGLYHGKIPLEPEQHGWWHGPLSVDEKQALLLYLRTLSMQK